MTKLSSRLALSFALLSGAAACGSDGAHEMDVSHIRPAVDEETIVLEVENGTPATFYELYLAPSGSKSWGPNQLKGGNEIAPGDTFELGGVPCDDYYDFRAIGEGKATIELKAAYLECGSQPIIRLYRKL